MEGVRRRSEGVKSHCDWSRSRTVVGEAPLAMAGEWVEGIVVVVRWTKEGAVVEEDGQVVSLPMSSEIMVRCLNSTWMDVIVQNDNSIGCQ